jgi:para-aminobenzoate synthetase / 4-amino-4-deoxychorismate lyase
VFLDTSKPVQGNDRSLLFLDPIERIKLFQGDDEKEYFKRISEFQSKGLYAAGWISYEFGYLLENNLRENLQREEDKGALLADLGIFPKPYIFQHSTGECDFPLSKVGLANSSWNVSDLLFSQTQEDYIKAINRVLEYIKAGDTYQVNYTLKLLFNFKGSPEAFYQDLRRNQSVSYGAYIRWGDERVLSFSPELFFRKQGNIIQVRPMKGTLKRGRTLKEDAGNIDFLANDIKNRSENVMIVDLLRNDLGRLMHQVAEGDIQVDSLFDVEVYETLLQMTSTITGIAKEQSMDEISLFNFFKAIFPCGSVTGAPKIRTMEIINELEATRRGVYTGAIGYLSPEGDAVFNVPIRTIALDGSCGEMGIGSGIVYDSEPESEWRECHLKGKFLTHPQEEFQLFETLLWQPDSGFWLLEEHLQRLQDSAEYFLFSFKGGVIKKALQERAQESGARSPQRVRIALNKDGTYEIVVEPCVAPKCLDLLMNKSTDDVPLPLITFSLTLCDSNEVWYYHKTTRRELYNVAYKQAQDMGYFDLCFCNEFGEVTEGCITNIIILENGTYYTPPISSGLLPGVMRQYLLQNSQGKCVERVLTKDNVRKADAVYLCNSVRGVVEVELKE